MILRAQNMYIVPKSCFVSITGDSVRKNEGENLVLYAFSWWASSEI